MIQSHVRVSLLLGILVLVCGCGHGPKLVPVSGTVKLDGQPLTDATVNFLFNDYPRPAVGRTDTSGKFSLSYNNRAGAPLGACKVMIRKQGKAAGDAALRELIPGRYNSNTQLQFEVTKQGPNEFNLDLNSTPDEADSANRKKPAPSNEEPPDSEPDADDPGVRKPSPQGQPPKNQNADNADEDDGG